MKVVSAILKGWLSWGKASQNQTQNTTRKTKDVTNDDDGFVW